MLRKTSIYWLIAVGVLAMTTALPAAEKGRGTAREAGYDGRYTMEPATPTPGPHSMQMRGDQPMPGAARLQHMARAVPGDREQGKPQQPCMTKPDAKAGQDASMGQSPHEMQRRHEGGEAKGQEHQEHMRGDGGMQMGQHMHDRWITPPAAYANKRSRRWGDKAAIARGKQLFQTYCMVCHGIDGKGTGPAARGLEHPPANLINHFHVKPGDGDAYLFWRVSEGGQVEPFKSMESAMPAFKTFLSEDQRWDVLSFVHTQFHRGFKEDMEQEGD